jgi:hypothetical protein
VLFKSRARVRGDAEAATPEGGLCGWLYNGQRDTVVVSLFGHGDGEEKTVGILVLAALQLWQLPGCVAEV